MDIYMYEVLINQGSNQNNEFETNKPDKRNQPSMSDRSNEPKHFEDEEEDNYFDLCISKRRQSERTLTSELSMDCFDETCDFDETEDWVTFDDDDDDALHEERLEMYIISILAKNREFEIQQDRISDNQSANRNSLPCKERYTFPVSSTKKVSTYGPARSQRDHRENREEGKEAATTQRGYNKSNDYSTTKTRSRKSSSDKHLRNQNEWAGRAA